MKRFVIILVLAAVAVAASSDISCPVCGMSVDDTSPYQLPWKHNQTTIFCSQKCRKAFQEDPVAFTKGATIGKMAPVALRASAAAMVLGCPVCGMKVGKDMSTHYVTENGNQYVYTCSAKHATTVHANMSAYILPVNDSHVPAGPNGKQPFCISGSVMWSGFKWHDEVCTILLFDSIRITSRAGLAGAFFVAFSIGVLIEVCHYVRRRIIKKIKRDLGTDDNERTEPLMKKTTTVVVFRKPRAPMWAKLANSLLFGASLCMAYLLMLIAMTYNLTLFIGVVSGLIVGHFVFSESLEVSISRESVEPCCNT